jgi:acetyltransferase-like isoleucine patch superfamily enzyme
MNRREAAKSAGRVLANIAVFPAVVSYRIRAAILGRDRALEGSTQALSLIPGILGQYLRRAFLARAIDHCDNTVTVEFGTIFSQAGARLERNAYVGPGCHLGLVHLEADVLLAAGVHVPSGGRTHGTSRVSIPIRDQPGERRTIRVGRGSWIGSAAIVLADVGCDTVVAAGSVVTRPLPDRVVAGGVPARIIKHRVESSEESEDRPATLTFRSVRD